MSAKRIKILATADRLQAWAELLGVQSAAFVPPTEEEVIEALEQVKIALTDEVRAKVKEVVAACTAAKAGTGEPLQSKYLIAQGKPAVEAKDGQFEWAEALKSKLDTPDGDEQIDYFAMNSIVTVGAGTVIGRVLPPTDGEPSVDVFGQERSPRKPKGIAVKLGAGVRPTAEGSDEITAEVAGRVLFKGGKIAVYEVLEIPGDVDFNSGSVEACVDVCVHGTVRSNFHVHTKKSLSVDKVIEAADVQADGDVVVRGGVFGQDGAGHVRAGGSVTAALLNEVRVDAKGDIHFNKEILNSRVRTFGKLIGEHGTIIGGEVYAREGVNVRVLGSEAAVATTVATGLDIDTLRRVRRIERKIRDSQKAAAQLRQAVQPLVANLKRLSAEQRERATELLSKADEMELQVDDLGQEGKRLLAAGTPTGSSSILVADAIHAGVQLMIGARVYRANKILHGPIKVELRKIDDATEMAAINQRTGSVTVLHCGEADLDAPPSDEEPEPKAKGEHQDGPQAKSSDKRRS